MGYPPGEGRIQFFRIIKALDAVYFETLAKLKPKKGK